MTNSAKSKTMIFAKSAYGKRAGDERVATGSQVSIWRCVEEGKIIVGPNPDLRYGLLSGCRRYHPERIGARDPVMVKGTRWIT